MDRLTQSLVEAEVRPLGEHRLKDRCNQRRSPDQDK
jgi:hypothetical protein